VNWSSAGSIKKNHYKIPHALKPVLDDNTDETLNRGLLNQAPPLGLVALG